MITLDVIVKVIANEVQACLACVCHSNNSMVPTHGSVFGFHCLLFHTTLPLARCRFGVTVAVTATDDVTMM